MSRIAARCLLALAVLTLGVSSCTGVGEAATDASLSFTSGKTIAGETGAPLGGTSLPGVDRASRMISVPHPYHSEVFDAPVYILPEVITLAPDLVLADAPWAVPAYHLKADTPAGTDLILRPSQVIPPFSCGQACLL